MTKPFKKSFESYQLDLRRSLAPAFDDKRLVTLEWTAPGDDFYHGRATRYEIQCFGDSDEFLVDQSVLPEPSLSGEREMTVLKIPRANELLYITLVAIDEVMQV